MFCKIMFFEKLIANIFIILFLRREKVTRNFLFRKIFLVGAFDKKSKIFRCFREISSNSC